MEPYVKDLVSSLVTLVLGAIGTSCIWILKSIYKFRRDLDLELFKIRRDLNEAHGKIRHIQKHMRYDHADNSNDDYQYPSADSCEHGSSLVEGESYPSGRRCDP